MYLHKLSVDAALAKALKLLLSVEMHLTVAPCGPVNTRHPEVVFHHRISHFGQINACASRPQGGGGETNQCPRSELGSAGADDCIR